MAWNPAPIGTASRIRCRKDPREDAFRDDELDNCDPKVTGPGYPPPFYPPKPGQWALWAITAIPASAAALSMLSFVVLGLHGWPGEFTGSSDMFCEENREPGSGVFLDAKQPVNTWSSVFYIIAGLGIARYSRSRWTEEFKANDGGGRDATSIPDTIGGWSHSNLFTRSATLQTLYATGVVAFAPGSMLFHAAGTDWACTLDVLAQLPFASFLVTYGWVRLRAQRSSGGKVAGGDARHSYRRLYLWHGALTAAISVPRILRSMDYALPIAALIAVFLVLELRIASDASNKSSEPVGCYIIGYLHCRCWPRKMIYLSLGLACILVGYVTMLLTATGAPFCQPPSLFQGHAVWHLLSSISTVYVFLYYTVAENDTGRDAERAAAHTTHELLSTFDNVPPTETPAPC